MAAQFAAAVGELYSNIYDRSAAPATGLVAFRAVPNRFEFVVADRGIGVLESLRSCTTYSGLSGHGEALRLTGC
jgi:anti-sigma regulatory factor (Ser/Thr protein kinase)